jgi:hypothetical protein
VFAVAAIALMSATTAVHFLSKPDGSSSEMIVERDSSGIKHVRLPEGVEVAISKNGQFEVRKRSDAEIILALLSGEGDFDVTHLDGRRVIVTTPQFDVEVIGTKFHVAVTGNENTSDVLVRVDRGTVQVRSNRNSGRSNVERRLTTGETWTSAVPSPSVAPSISNTNPPEIAPSLPSSVDKENGPARSSAKELFESAERLRMNGRLRDAAAQLDSLRRQFPGDSRAPLAAFELGRIRMDGLGDYAGAATAFESSLKLNPSASFREDVEARLVTLYDRMGQASACEASKRAYLARYPRGSHVSSVGRACGR